MSIQDMGPRDGHEEIVAPSMSILSGHMTHTVDGSRPAVVLKTEILGRKMNLAISLEQCVDFRNMIEVLIKSYPKEFAPFLTNLN